MSATSRTERRFTEQMCWGTVYWGSRAELAAAGVVREGEFPGDPGQRKCHNSPDRERRIMRQSRDRFIVYVQMGKAVELARADDAFGRFMARAISFEGAP